MLQTKKAKLIGNFLTSTVCVSSFDGHVNDDASTTINLFHQVDNVGDHHGLASNNIGLQNEYLFCYQSKGAFSMTACVSRVLTLVTEACVCDQGRVHKCSTNGDC